MKVFYFLFLASLIFGQGSPELNCKRKETDDPTAGASGELKMSGSDGTSDNYTYTINAARSSHTIAPTHPVLYMYYQITPNQNLTYFVTVNDERPLEIEAYYIQNFDTGDDYGRDEKYLTNACKDPAAGTWDYVVVKMIQGSIMPDGHCPINAGNYDIPLEVKPITVTFPKKIPCGEYETIINLVHANSQCDNEWVVQMEYTFIINDDGNCAS